MAKMSQTEKKVLVVLGALVLLCACTFVVGAAIAVFSSGAVSSLTGVGGAPQASASKLPHYGVFLKTAGSLTELDMQPGMPKSATVSTQESQPTLVVWLQNANVQLLMLSPMGPGGAIAYNATPTGNGVLTLVPSKPLSAGKYCLTQGDPSMPAIQIPNWCFSVSSGVAATAPTATPVPLFKFSVQNLATGDQALQRAKLLTNEKPQEGWQFVTLDVVMEAVAGEPLVPIKCESDINYSGIDGAVIDSGGYRREFQTVFRDECPLMFRGFRYTATAYTKMPLNQTPKSVELLTNFNRYTRAQVKRSFDVQEIKNSNVKIPFDALPNIPVWTTGPLEYREAAKFRVAYTNFHLEETPRVWDGKPHVFIMGSFELENLGGNNISRDSPGPTIITIDSRGQYARCQKLYSTGDVPPGLTKRGTWALGYRNNCDWVLTPDLAWVWVGFLDANGKPFSQMQLFVKDAALGLYPWN